ncbi:hypothetical protein LR48_Vigan03g166100 [Vigna angularis]|uniref:Uncharacterized protein n=2 Tax=Phaseolus angularis TaxID=3914 RepID=A0A0L9U757_PHAAN|nr:hypothetical protein LR48_Vigan03g166100 [Vigna angularis]
MWFVDALLYWRKSFWGTLVVGVVLERVEYTESTRLVVGEVSVVVDSKFGVSTYAFGRERERFGITEQVLGGAEVWEVRGEGVVSGKLGEGDGFRGGEWRTQSTTFFFFSTTSNHLRSTPLLHTEQYTLLSSFAIFHIITRTYT